LTQYRASDLLALLQQNYSTENFSFNIIGLEWMPEVFIFKTLEATAGLNASRGLGPKAVLFSSLKQRNSHDGR
jgi:hypothetical protein